MFCSNLKKTLLLLVACCGLALAAQAQTAGAGRPAHTKPTPEARVERMAQELQLTAGQKTQFLQLEQGHRARMDALHQANATDKRAQADTARAAHRQAQRALLTPEQAVKFDAMPQKRHGQGQRGGKSGGKCQGTKKA